MLLLPFVPFGLLIGALGRVLAGPKSAFTVVGWLSSLLVGAVGAVLGGTLGRVLLLDRSEGPQGFALSLLGALLFVIVHHSVRRRHLKVAEVGDR
jgi:uncharacterized membrane protein YeaQ/YmgE (transglycosylase-associated protein family)